MFGLATNAIVCFVVGMTVCTTSIYRQKFAIMVNSLHKMYLLPIVFLRTDFSDRQVLEIFGVSNELFIFTQFLDELFYVI